MFKSLVRVVNDLFFYFFREELYFYGKDRYMSVFWQLVLGKINRILTTYQQSDSSDFQVFTVQYVKM